MIHSRFPRSTVVRVTLAALLLVLAARSATADVVEKDITYGKADGVELKLDLARPGNGDGPHPAIVFIHGGGWSRGHRGHHHGEIRTAAERGYVAVTVEYRLTGADERGRAEFPFPAQVHDVKCAVRWLRAHAKKYRIDPRRIGAAGPSAGGHLSLMLGVTDKSHGLEGDCGYADQSSRVQAVVNIFGPTDMLHAYETTRGGSSILETFLNGTPDEAEERYKAASPVTYVSEDDPPMLTLHGTDDTLVPPSQAKRFDRAMRKAGAAHTLKLLKGQGHGLRDDARETVVEALFAFFDEHLKSDR